jgi:4-hydroxybenzoate polyprenyltransferase
MSPVRPPIVVDLDGSLIRTDLLHETATRAVFADPRRLFAIVRQLRRGKAPLKRYLAGVAPVDAETLPYRDELVDWLRSQRDGGRSLVLASAADEQIVTAVAAHLGLFDQARGSDGTTNLRSEAKRDLLRRLYPDGFEYVGNHRHDLPVWAAATVGHVVGGPSLARKVSEVTVVGDVVPGSTVSVRSLVHALRPHQWVKNALVFVPLFTASLVGDADMVLHSIYAFVAFCLAASGVYVLNDLVDLPHDRKHPRKRRRPFAAGTLSLVAGWLMWPVLTLAAFCLAVPMLPAMFALVLLGYLVCTLGYSFWGKRKPVVDVVALAALYTVRIVAGAVALSVAVSIWLATFSLLFFLSLALVKRVSELTRLRRDGQLSLGRGYQPSDLELLSSYGVSTSVGAVVIFALYLNDPGTTSLYETPEFLWAALPVLLAWLMRVWLLAHRGAMNEDPVVFAVTDPKSLVAGVLVFAAFAAAKLLTT